MVSSRAGGEGINLQVARRLVHIDVPWNPMELEQRVGRVHRFGSRATVLVDTLVMRDSREEEAYAVADQKLRMITKALVPPDRFDALFSRVMTLIPPEELQEALLRRRTVEVGWTSKRLPSSYRRVQQVESFSRQVLIRAKEDSGVESWIGRMGRRLRVPLRVRRGSAGRWILRAPISAEGR